MAKQVEPGKSLSSPLLRDGAASSAAASTLTAGDWYQEVIGVQRPWGGWFGLWDCLCRYMYSVGMFYFCLLTCPINFTIYTWKFNLLWYGKLGCLLTLLGPALPVGLVLMELIKKVKSYFDGPDWMMAGPGRVFFLKPPNPIADLLWSCYLNTSMFVGQFLLAGTHPDAISHTWVDTILTKDFWRAALEGVDARVPRQLGRWVDGGLTLQHDVTECDVVVKVPDSYLGIGDSFWNWGADFTSEDQLRQQLAREYVDKEALVLELVRPRKDLGVHSLDIVTVRVPGDGVRVLSVLLWTDCTTDTSHSCRAGYIVDADTEMVVAAAEWYCAAFADMQAPLIGTKFPGVREACEKAVAAHARITEKWLVAVGWDAMVMEKDEIVFFEGNFAGARTPRRVFLSWAALCASVWNNFWPFGAGNSVTPHAKCC